MGPARTRHGRPVAGPARGAGLPRRRSLRPRRFGTSLFLDTLKELFERNHNLTDITLDPVYSSICGYTEGDLDTVFAPELDGVDRERVREWYNGYSWLGAEKVYNPCDVLLLRRGSGESRRCHWTGR